MPFSRATGTWVGLWLGEYVRSEDCGGTANRRMGWRSACTEPAAFKEPKHTTHSPVVNRHYGADAHTHTHTDIKHERMVNKAPVMRGEGGNAERKKEKNMPLAQPAKRQQDSGNKMFPNQCSQNKSKSATEISNKSSGLKLKEVLSALAWQAGNLCKAYELCLKGRYCQNTSNPL